MCRAVSILTFSSESLCRSFEIRKNQLFHRICDMDGRSNSQVHLKMSCEKKKLVENRYKNRFVTDNCNGKIQLELNALMSTESLNIRPIESKIFSRKKSTHTHTSISTKIKEQRS